MIKFALRNEYNQEYGLTSSKTHYMPSPSGLGYAMNGEYARIGYGWVVDNLADAQSSISGEVYFQGTDCFKEFQNLAKFVRTASKLKFVYQNQVGEFLRDVDVSSIEHQGMAGHNTLKCTLNLVGRSLWYSNSVTNYTISTVSSDTMRYPYIFPSTFRGSVDGQIDVTNDGSVEAPFTVSFIGPIVNPTLTLYQDEKMVSRINIIGEADVGESIEFSTVDGDLYCYRQKSDSQVSLVADLDIENDNFFKIPIGTSQIKLSAGADITQPVKVTVRKLYRAV